MSEPELMTKRDRAPLVPASLAGGHMGWVASCCVHTVLFVILGLLWRPVVRGTGGEPDRPIGIAVVHQTSDGNNYYSLRDSGSSSASSNVQAPQSNLTVATQPMSLESILADVLDSGADVAAASAQATGADLSGTGLSGSGNTSGSGSPGKGSGGLNQTQASFLGVTGTGSSFVYVLDRSDSMNALSSAPFLLAKRELLKSIQSLGPAHQFQILFYNDSISPMSGALGGRNRLLFAKDTEKARATQFIRGMIANGGTEHLPALKGGLSFAPDVLFFMTDAEEPRLNQAQLADLQERAAQSGTTIHTIQFAPGEPTGDGGWLRALAEMNRGKYRYVNVDTIEIERE
jgi:hypothetical protein